ncbi:MAG: 1,4-dihydroxy-2-naphthoate polyprenyltransferase [Acidimicrobiia bacterium]|nr:MAG: 1,4-dihydroxy-2-naphthoate polyprenyltransferase [Acidimicrobiia bacterium]
MKPWLLAARPATLTAAVAPVLVGSALAAAAHVFGVDTFLVILFAALAIQVGVNFANDLADATSGADTADRIGPQRAVASGLLTPTEMKRGIGIAFALAAIAGIYLIWLGGWVILVIGVVSIVAALAYTAGPYPYGYHGFGEVFVFTFFGLVATAGTRYVFDRSAPADAWWAGVAMGLLATAILVANNYRDLDTDLAVGKRTLAVILGRETTRRLYAAMIGGAFLTIAVSVTIGSLPLWSLLALVTIPRAGLLVRALFTETSGPALIVVLKGTARLQLVFAALLSIGVLIGPA